tara:strand:+ start:831 stop:1154 length:324 start_codon:yes stop_codon:yes gene_type:complete
MIPTRDITGTTLQGNLEISYNKLTKIFGEPHVKRTAPLDNKTDVEWHFIEKRDEVDNVVFTIYNWKNGPSYTGKGKVEEITEWNVGGYNSRSLDIVTNEIYKEKIVT